MLSRNCASIPVTAARALGLVEFVRLRREDQDRPPRRHESGKELEVERLEAVSRIDDEHEADQRRARRDVLHRKSCHSCLSARGTAA